MSPYSRFLPLFLVLLYSCSQHDDRSWSIYKADNTSSSYSPHDEINRSNVARLKIAWTFDPNDAIDGARMAGSQCNPIVVDGIMYVASSQRTIFALDAAGGSVKWAFDPNKGKRGGGSFRGVTYWEKGNDKRILFTSADQLYALDAETGLPITTFGDSGRVSMNVGMRGDPTLISIKPTSPGIIYKDLIIIGNEVSELYGAQPGYVRAYNVETGKLEWTFHTIPLPGQFGYDTWPENAWKYAGGANSWGGMSIDEKRGLVFFSTGSPSYDFYGADRKGTNLFGNCVVALDASTGKRRWHFQTVHHDLWDYDLPASPNLVTVTHNGKKIDAVAQTSKVGFLYLLDRETGESLFPIEERKVPASDVPGEAAWPTQPYPLKPAPYAKQSFSADDLANFSPASNDSLREVFSNFRYDGLFTPPSVKGTLYVPGTIGGAEWGGAAYDPETSVIYLKSNEAPEAARLLKIENNLANKAATGKTIYATYCAVCHKADRSGEEPLYPSLIDLKRRMTEEQALKKIRTGGGKMPPFASIIRGNEQAIINFLFDKRSEGEGEVEEIIANQGTTAGQQVTGDSLPVYINTTAYALLKDAAGRPFIKPPYATLNAIDLNTGEYLWRVPAGNIKEWQQPGAERTGATGSPGPMVTRGGLVFQGAGRSKMIEAYDKSDGKLLWEFNLPGIASSNPSSYKVNGKQYIAISVAGNEQNPSGSVMAFSLE